MQTRAIASSVLVLLLLLAGSSMFAIGARAAGDLDGRLGGSVESFIAAFGEPLPDEGGSGYLFPLDDEGSLRVQFNRTGGEPRPDDPALLITASAPRPAAWPALEPHEADWTLPQALEIATRLLPKDARIDEGAGTDDGRAVMPCQSDALESRFGVLTLGQCSVTLIQPENDTVSYLTVSLTGASDAADSEAQEPAACDGLVDWSQTTSVRLSRAQAILGDVSTLDPESTETDAALEEYATTLLGLSNEQRTEAAPAAAATANYYVISALTGYARAVELAAEGTAEADQTKIDAAVAEIRRANAAVTTATEEIQLAVDDCGLAIDPVATPTGGP